MKSQPSLDRFHLPSPQEQQEWILCDGCNSAQAEVKKQGQYLCADCAEKKEEQNEAKKDSSILPE